MSIIMALSCTLICAPAFAAEKRHVEEALEELETKDGYIPGGTASVQYNCFGFVSDICSKIYGVSFYYEQQDGNYLFNHSENYYTVSSKVFKYSDSPETRSKYARDLRDWMLDNAAVGDILQYGSADRNYSKKHTVLIQHIDDEKLQVIHSNYETNYIPATAVRVDTIYWQSLIDNPVNNEYNGSEIRSLNLLFGTQMKLTQGFGISINRFSKLEQSFYLDKGTRYKAKITKTERKSCTSVNVKWKKIDGASAYCLEYKAGSGGYRVVSVDITADNYTVTGLTVGTLYTFRVKAYANGKWNEYSDEVTKRALPPMVGKVDTALTPEGIKLSFNKRSDIYGAVITRADAADAEPTKYFWLSKDTVEYTDREIEYGKTYYYYVYRYSKLNNTNIYSEKPKAAVVAYTLETPQNVAAENTSPTAIKVSWNAVDNAQYYRVKYTNTATNEKKTVKVENALDYKITGLKTGVKYKIYVKAGNAVGASAYSPKKKLTSKPKKAKIVTVSSTKTTVTLKWKKQSSVSGYNIYRSTEKKGEYKLVKTVKGASKTSFKDSGLARKTRYYYKVRSYKTVKKVKVEGSASSVKSAKTK
jgi:hypothetical protein